MRPDASLAHFVHIPWPEPNLWRVLPERIRVAIHDGLLANDVVGFHADRWRRSFIRSSRDLLEADCDFDRGVCSHRSGRTFVAARPISVDASEFEELAESEQVLRLEDELEARRPEFLILRVDRTDPSKNVVRGFRAFEYFLDAHPEMHGRVGMLALLDPSRQDIPEYAEYLGAIQRAARVVNDRFQRGRWTPVDLRIEDNFPLTVAAYKQYDVLLVNAIYDGLNLVAKEAPLVNERDGVLILSENAGAHEELGPWALSVNPFDIEEQAQAIQTAIEMSRDERRARLEAIREHVRTHDVGAWLESQLEDLDRASAKAGAVSRPLARRRHGACAHGRRRRQGGLAKARGGPCEPAHGACDRAQAARASEGRRTRRRPARGDHGREADERADPALSSASAHARRRRAFCE